MPLADGEAAGGAPLKLVDGGVALAVLAVGGEGLAVEGAEQAGEHELVGHHGEGAAGRGCRGEGLEGGEGPGLAVLEGLAIGQADGGWIGPPCGEEFGEAGDGLGAKEAFQGALVELGEGGVGVKVEVGPTGQEGGGGLAGPAQGAADDPIQGEGGEGGGEGAGLGLADGVEGDVGPTEEATLGVPGGLSVADDEQGAGGGIAGQEGGEGRQEHLGGG